MKVIKYFVFFVLFASMLPVVSSCEDGDDEEEEIVVGGRNQLFKQIIGSWMCSESYIVRDGKEWEEDDFEYMFGKKLEFHSDASYSTDFPVFDKTGIFEVGNNTITLIGDDGNTYTIEIIDANIIEWMKWQFTTKDGQIRRLLMYRS